LATDLRRYLNVEPILARPPSVIYQLPKWVGGKFKSDNEVTRAETFFAGFVWSSGQRQHRRPVAFESLAGHLRMPAQPPLSSAAVGPIAGGG